MDFQSNDQLRSYISIIDDKANALLEFYLKQVYMFSSTLMKSNFPDSQDRVRTGCRIWVRYLNNIDLDVDSNIRFVKQDSSEDGQHGYQFSQLLINQGDIIGKINSLKGQSIDLMPYLEKQISGANILLTFASLFNTGSAQQKEIDVTKEALRLMKDLLQTFNEFIDKYSKEYSLQFNTTPSIPWILPVVIEPPIVNPPAVNPPITNNSTYFGIDFSKPQNIFIAFLLFLIIALIIKNRLSHIQ